MKTALVIILFLGNVFSSVCQNAQTSAKIKSLLVTVEKQNGLIKKQYKDSETLYDYRGNILESISYKQGKIDKHFKYEYNPDNNKIKEVELDSYGRIKESSEYKYVNGLRTEKTVYNANQKIKSKKIYVYTPF